MKITIKKAFLHFAIILGLTSCVFASVLDLPLVDGLPPAVTDIARLKPIQSGKSAAIDTTYIRKPFTLVVYPSEGSFTIKVYYKSVKDKTQIKPKLTVRKSDNTVLETHDFTAMSSTTAQSESLTITIPEANQPYQLEVDPDGEGGLNGAVRITGTIAGGCGLLADDYISFYSTGQRNLGFYVPPGNQDVAFYISTSEIYNKNNGFQVRIYNEKGTDLNTYTEALIKQSTLYRFPRKNGAGGLWRIWFTKLSENVSIRMLAPATPVAVFQNGNSLNYKSVTNLTLAVGSESATGDYTWCGGVAGGWYNPACWSGVTDGTVPHLTGDTVTFPSGAGEVDMLQGAYTLAGFTNNSADLELANGEISLSGNATFALNEPAIFRNITLRGGGLVLGDNSHMVASVEARHVDVAAVTLNFPFAPTDSSQFGIIARDLPSGTYRVLTAQSLTLPGGFLENCQLDVGNKLGKLFAQDNTIFLLVSTYPPSNFQPVNAIESHIGQYLTTPLPAAPGTAATIDMEWLDTSKDYCLLGAKNGERIITLVGLQDGKWGYACSASGEWVDTGISAETGHRYQVRSTYNYDKQLQLFVDGINITSDGVTQGDCEYLGLNYALLGRNLGDATDQKSCAKIYAAQLYREDPRSVDSALKKSWQAISNFTFTCSGKTVTFPTRRIDWTTHWDETSADNGLYTFSRLQFLDDLIAYYEASHDDAAVTVFGEIMTTFYEDCPKPDDLENYTANSSDYPCWRTIQAGWRGPVLADAYLAFSTSPAWTSAIDATFRLVVEDHIARLKVRRTSNNWRTIESRGLIDLLLTVPNMDIDGTILAATERSLYEDLKEQIYDDGFHFELSPFYHGTIPDNYKEIVARYTQMGLQTPTFCTSPEMKLMYEFYPKIIRPDFVTPPLNDSYEVDASAKMKAALAYFPECEDFRYVATKRVEGTPPNYLSYLFPNSGAVIFRSDWTADAVWGYVDMSPMGESTHRNDDKLNFLMYAYGKEMLIEAGRSEAKDSPMRRYTLGSQSHNTILIDGYGQNYRHRYKWDDTERHSQAELTSDISLENTIDWAMASYNNGYGKNSSEYTTVSTVTHTRKVEFIKGSAPYFRITDTLTSTDTAEHSYQVLWHLAKSVTNNCITIANNEFTASFGDNVSLTATVSSTGTTGAFVDLRGTVNRSTTNSSGISYEEISTDEWTGANANNLQGWLPADSGIGKTAIHTPVYEGTFTGSATIITELRPSRQDGNSQAE